MRILSISTNSLNNTAFTQKAESKNQSPTTSAKPPKNPISKKGEAANLVLTTFLGGMILAGRLLWEVVVDGDFELDRLSKKAENLVNKNKKNLSPNKKFLCVAGTFVGLITAGCAAFGAIVTLFSAPKIVYKSKVNAFKKSKDMDVYVKANDAEKELYTQLSDKAKDSTPEEKETLKDQYMKLSMAKNQVPDFVDLKNKK